MARSVDLKQTIQVNEKPMSISNIAKLYKNSKDIRFEKGNVIIGGRRGVAESIFSLADLDEDVLYSLFASDLGSVSGLFSAFYEYNKTVEDKTTFVQEILESTTNFRLIPEISSQKKGEPFFTALERKANQVPTMVKNLNSQQANGVLKQAYTKEMETLKEGKKPTVSSAEVWASLSDVVKYSPEVFAQVTASKGAPLIPGLSGYNKLVNKQKLLAAVLKHPDRIDEYIQAFGSRSFYSDTQFIQNVAKGFKDKAFKLHDESKMEEFLKHIETLQNGSANYLKEVKELQSNGIVPTGLTKEQFDKYLSAKPKRDKSLGKFTLSTLEKDFIRDSVMKFDLSKFAEGAKPEDTEAYMKAWVENLQNTKKFNGKKINVNTDKLFLDQMFMKELLGSTLQSAAIYRFYYGATNEKGGKQHLTVVEIQKSINNFAGQLFEKEKEHANKLKPFKTISANETMKTLEKEHDSTELQFSDSAKLPQKQRDKIIKDIENGKYAGEKGAKKMDKLFQKQGAKIASDNALVNAMLEAVEDKAKEEALAVNGKTKLDDSVTASVDKYKPVHDQIYSHYDKHLTQLDKLTISEQKLMETLEQNPEFVTQQAHLQAQQMDQGMERK